MSYPLLILLAILGLVLQSTLFTHLALAGVKPDIILVLAIFHSIFKAPLQGASFGFLLGLIEDIYLGRFIGMNALAKALSCYIISWFAQGAFRENQLVPIIAVFLGTLINSLAVLVLGMLMGLDWKWGLGLWIGIPAAIYNSCLVPFFYARFFVWATRDQEREGI